MRKEGDMGPGSSSSFQISGTGPTVFCNSQMSVEQIDRYCELCPGTRAFLERAVSLLLSARGVHRSLRVARVGQCKCSAHNHLRRPHVFLQVFP